MKESISRSLPQVKTIPRICRLVLVATLIVSATRITPAVASSQTKTDPLHANPAFFFESNQGQTNASVKFFSHSEAYTLFLTASEAVFSLPVPAPSVDQGRDVVRMKLRGGNASAVVRGRDILSSKSNYLTGNNPKKWRTKIARYSQVEFSQVYPGIDMIYYWNKGQLEYDFVVAPGADAAAICMDFQGAKNLELDQQGNLVLNLSGRKLAFNAPVLYQKSGDTKKYVEGHFVLVGHGQVRFEVGAYDKNSELVIDPSLMFSTYLGGAGDDRANAIALDSAGNIYLAGTTVSNGFPGSASGFQPAKSTGTDVFVTKISAAGAIVWSTYLGGAGIDIATGIAVDGLGIVHITGSTTSADFPTANAFQAASGGGTDGFVAALNAAGTALVYSTYLGGAGEDESLGIAVDASGNAYVTGDTDVASAVTFPTTLGAYQTLQGGAYDAFICKFSPTGTISYSTFVGGTGIDVGKGIAIDGSGNAYVTGRATAAFPTIAGAFRTTILGASDGFVVKLNPTGTTMLYSSYFGGSDLDDATAIALDGTNPATLNVYITGSTGSTDFPAISFPRVVGQARGTGDDAYVFKLNMNGGGGLSDGVYSTYLGASGVDAGAALKLDALGNVYVTGHTVATDFPVTPNATQSVNSGTGIVFVTEIDPTGAAKVFSTYLGGTTDQTGNGIALDNSRNIYVAGWTNSINFPTSSPIQAANAGTFDAFLTKISAPSPLPAVASLSPTLGPIGGGTTVVITGSGFTGITGMGGVTFGAVNATSYTVNSNTQITSVAPAHAAGIVDIVATSTMGASTIVSADSYTYFTPPPAITGVSQSSGTTTGGTSVVITGSGFTGVTGVAGVKFGAVNATSYTINSNLQITVIAPAHTAGIVDIVATSPAGSSPIVAGDAYTFVTPPPAITGVSPSSGTTTGGISVVITGSGFTGVAGAAGLKFGAVNATSYTVDSNIQITAVTPSHAAGIVDVIATSPAGSSSIVAGDVYTFGTPPPAITGVVPSSGTTTGGTSVIVTGSGFTGVIGAAGVKFGAVDATSYTVNSNSQITAVTPPHAAGIVDIVATSPAGSSSIVAGDAYTYFVFTPAPTITNLNPNSGSIGGGTAVVITGLGFIGVVGAGGVTLGGVNAASYTIDSNTQITMIAPPHAEGSVDVVVTSPAGSSSMGPNDIYLYSPMPAPTITSVDPKLGPIGGGTSVVILGSGFKGMTGVTSVQFGSVNAASYSVDSNTQITAVAPTQAAGSVAIVVTSLAGLSSIGLDSAFAYTAAAPVIPCLDPYLFPSPAVGSTAHVAYCMAESGLVKIRVYNEIGELVDALEESKSVGPQNSSINVGKFAPGVYFYLLSLHYDTGNTEKHAKQKFVVLR